MAKQVIILTKTLGPGGDQNVSYVFWFAVPVGNQIPAPGFVSAYRGATAAESSALQAGTVIEESTSSQYPAAFTTVQIESDLQARWTTENTRIAGLPNPNQFYGAFWDGTAWTAGVVVPGRLNRYQFASASGIGTADITVVSAVAGQTVQVYQAMIIGNGVGTIQLKSGGSNLGPALPVVAGVPIVLAERTSGEPWFATAAGNSFQFAVSLATVTGVVLVWYQQI